MITQGALGERAHTANGMFLALKECNLESLVELLLEHNRENKEPYIKHIKVAIYSKRRKTGKDQRSYKNENRGRTEHCCSTVSPG